MPWREICPMDEKMRLVAAVLADEHSMSELCASLGVSRKTGYKWLLRYRGAGRRRAARAFARTASGAVGDRGGPSTSGVDPVWWTVLGRKRRGCPQCREHMHHTQRSTGGGWSSWRG